MIPTPLLSHSDFWKIDHSIVKRQSNYMLRSFTNPDSLSRSDWNKEL